MKFMILNGPNLNLLGTREPEIYGNTTYHDLIQQIEAYAVEKDITVSCFQSNHEGVLVDKIQEASFQAYDGIIINPAAYTHTSVALLDAVKSVQIPTIEIHISDPETRESFRHISYIRDACIKTIKGKGLSGYFEAIDYLLAYLS